MNNGAYLLVRFSGQEHLLPALRELGNMDKVDRWDAVEGHYNLVVMMGSADAGGVDKVRTLDGVADMKVCEIIEDGGTAESVDPEFCRAYAFLEADPDQKDDIRSRLSKIEEIASVAHTSGGCDFIALVVGENFDRIDRVVDEKIRPLDGLLRLKQDRIIDLDNL